MQRAALVGIAAKAGPRLPIMSGPDRGLPKTLPTFDMEELKRRNIDVLKKRAMERGVGRVGK
jgi:hypothetical protein